MKKIKHNKKPNSSPFRGGVHPDEIGRCLFQKTVLRAVKESEFQNRIEIYGIGGFRKVSAELADQLCITHGVRARHFFQQFCPELIQS